jgi:hypothetical protein
VNGEDGRHEQGELVRKRKLRDFDEKYTIWERDS